MVNDDIAPREGAPDGDDTPVSTRLANTFDWPKHCILAAALGAILVGLLAYRHTNGWVEAALAVTALVGGYCLWTWWRGQHWIEVTGDGLRIGGVRSQVVIHGCDVSAVKYVMNRHSPDFTLVTTDGHKHTVRTSRLEKGHSTLFAWLGEHAPQARSDKGTLRIRQMLETRGLLP